MTQQNFSLLALVREHKERAAHWRTAHYASCRFYQCIDNWLGIPSVILATVILGFAFYAVDRPNAPLWTQFTLASLTVVHGILTALQMYIRPGALYELYRNSAINFGSTQRKWMALEKRILQDSELSGSEFDSEFNEVLLASDRATREARPVPKRIYM